LTDNHMNQQISRPCPVCMGEDYKILFLNEFKGPKAPIAERLMDYEVVACNCCGHIRARTGQPDDFIPTLYSQALEKEQWSVDGGAPYSEMIEFFESSTKNFDKKPRKVVDVGCGRGDLLKMVWDKWSSNECEVFGVDFRANSDAKILVEEFDLSVIDQMKLSSPMDGYDIAFCSHVLEHMIDPRATLRGLRQRAADEGLLYIEVPDHSFLSKDIVLNSNLWSAQHLQYFSLHSLTNLAVSCGWKIVSAEGSDFGFVPRARLVLQAVSERDAIEASILSRQKMAGFWAFTGNLIKEYAKKGPVAVWGVGTDFVKIHQAVDISNIEDLAVFDRDAAGHKVLSYTVKNSLELRNTVCPIIVLPRPSNTRKSMHKVAKSWGVTDRVIDPVQLIENDTYDEW